MNEWLLGLWQNLKWQFRGGALPLYRGPIEGFELFWSFTQVLGLVISALILVFFFKDFSDKIIGGASMKIWKNLLYGFAAFIAVPALVFLLFITLIGFIPGIILSMAYGALFAVSMIYSGMIFGAWAFKFLRGSKEFKIDWLTAAAGSAALFAIGLIPILGWVIYFFFLLLSMGSIIGYIFKKI